MDGQTLRAEVKLYCAGLLARGLGLLRAWRRLDLDALFFELLGKYNIVGAVQKQTPLASDEQTLSKPQLRVYSAWLAGQELESLYSRATIWSHRRAILEAIFAKYCPDVEGGIDLPHILSPENIMVLPERALRDRRYHPPRDGG